LGGLIEGRRGDRISRLASGSSSGNGTSAKIGRGKDGGLADGKKATPGTIRMKIEILSSALEDLYEGRLFYEKQG